MSVATASPSRAVVRARADLPGAGAVVRARAGLPGGRSLVLVLDPSAP